MRVTCAPTGFSTEVGRRPAEAVLPLHLSCSIQGRITQFPKSQRQEALHLHPTAASAHTEVYTRSHRMAGAPEATSREQSGSSGLASWVGTTAGGDRAGKASEPECGSHRLRGCSVPGRLPPVSLALRTGETRPHCRGRAQSRRRAATRPRGTSPRGAPHCSPVTPTATCARTVLNDSRNKPPVPHSRLSRPAPCPTRRAPGSQSPPAPQTENTTTVCVQGKYLVPSPRK